MIRSVFAGPVFAAALFLLALTPLPASAALLTPLVPTQCNCPSSAPDYGCVLQVLQNAMNDAIGFGTLFVVLVIAYSGFLFMTTGGSAENRTRARTLFTNAIVGLLLMFSAWLIVDFVMKTLYNSSSYGPWNTILAPDSTTSACIKQGATKSLTDGGVVGTITSVFNAGNVNSSSGGYTGTGFSYQSGVQPQAAYASAELSTLLNCMATKVPSGVGQISAITEKAIQSGQKTMQQCAAGGASAGCAHAANSCHYGGVSCVGRSYAVDFGDEQNYSALKTAATACGADFINYEDNHTHISVGKACGCN